MMVDILSGVLPGAVYGDLFQRADSRAAQGPGRGPLLRGHRPRALPPARGVQARHGRHVRLGQELAAGRRARRASSSPASPRTECRAPAAPATASRSRARSSASSTRSRAGSACPCWPSLRTGGRCRPRACPVKGLRPPRTPGIARGAPAEPWRPSTSLALRNRSSVRSALECCASSVPGRRARVRWASGGHDRPRLAPRGCPAPADGAAADYRRYENSLCDLVTYSNKLGRIRGLGRGKRVRPDPPHARIGYTCSIAIDAHSRMRT